MKTRNGYVLIILSIAGIALILRQVGNEDRYTQAYVRQVSIVDDNRVINGHAGHSANDYRHEGEQVIEDNAKVLRLVKKKKDIPPTNHNPDETTNGLGRQEAEGGSPHSTADPANSPSKKDDSAAQALCKSMFMNGLEPLSKESNNTKAWGNSQCNNLLCNSTVDDTCQWSFFAIDTLLENATTSCDSARVEQFFPDPYWDEYRFSDTTRGRMETNAHTKFPGSLIDDVHMLKLSGIKENVVPLAVAKRAAHTPLDQRPMPDTLVVHLRLGDVVDWAIDPVRDLLMEQKYFFRRCNNETNHYCDINPWERPYNPPATNKWNKYVKPLSYYSSLTGLDRYKSVVIMATAHVGTYGRRATRSCHYTSAIRSYFQRRMPHATITVRSGNPPDDDIVFAALASSFVEGAGGFSTLLLYINNRMKEDKFQKIIAPETSVEKPKEATPSSNTEDEKVIAQDSRTLQGNQVFPDSDVAATQTKQCRDLFMSGLEPLTQKAHRTKAWMSNQCNDLFCHSTAKGRCKWSFFGIDTLMELEKGSSVCDAAHVEDFFPYPHWEGYRFSDYVNNRKKREVGNSHQQYPGSLIDDIHKMKEAGIEDAVGLAMVDHIAQTPMAKQPKPNTLVIHLRLGDVIDGAVDSVRDLLFEEKYYFRRCNNATNDFCERPWERPYNLPLRHNWNKYVKPLSYYSALEGLDDYKEVVIMGSAHIHQNYKLDATPSCQYTAALKTYLQRRMPKATITLRLGNPPDQDILFAAQVERFIASGGGFAKELEKMNQRMKLPKYQRLVDGIREDNVIDSGATKDRIQAIKALAEKTI